MSTARQSVNRRQAHPPFFVGIDLGATNTKIGVVDDLGQTLSYRTIPTGDSDDPKDVVRQIAEEVLDTIHVAEVQVPEVARLGVGAPGPMDIRQGLLIAPVNMPAWRNLPLRDQLSQHCRLPLTFANDAAAAAFGEYWLGAGRNVHSLV